MSEDSEYNFLSVDEKERYEKHITLREIGIKGQI